MTVENIRSEAEKYGIDLSGDTFTVCVISPDTGTQNGEDQEGIRLLQDSSKKSHEKGLPTPQLSLLRMTGLCSSPSPAGKMQWRDYAELMTSAAGYCKKARYQYFMRHQQRNIFPMYAANPVP